MYKGALHAGGSAVLATIDRFESQPLFIQTRSKPY
jgi:hypothetical protein